MRHAFLAVLLLCAAPAFAERAPAPPAPRTIEVKVTESGFEPREIALKTGQPVRLVFTRVTEHTCIKAIDIHDAGVSNLQLPLGKPVSVTLTPRKAGLMPFHCSAMGMGNGKLVVSD